jgi:site-specific recombinase XerD
VSFVVDATAADTVESAAATLVASGAIHSCKAIRTTAGYRQMLARTGDEAEFPFPVHPHMLRHACGSKLANDGQDTRAVQHYLRRKKPTVRYTEL